MKESLLAEDEKMKLGIRVRDELISIATGDRVRHSLERLVLGEPAIELDGLLPQWMCAAVLDEMRDDPGWKLECWQLLASSEVALVSDEDFQASSPEARFSRNYCLRKPLGNSFALRGFLAALKADDVEDAFSRSFGLPVKFRSADIARYSYGQYLRRHADNFEDRRFGFVWYFCDGWGVGDGGELIVESAFGNSIVIPPRQGTAAVIRIQSDYHHQVAAIRSSVWQRFSVASHYHEQPGHAPATVR